MHLSKYLQYIIEIFQKLENDQSKIFKMISLINKLYNKYYVGNKITFKFIKFVDDTTAECSRILTNHPRLAGTGIMADVTLEIELFSILKNNLFDEYQFIDIFNVIHELANHLTGQYDLNLYLSYIEENVISIRFIEHRSFVSSILGNSPFLRDDLFFDLSNYGRDKKRTEDGHILLPEVLDELLFGPNVTNKGHELILKL